MNLVGGRTHKEPACGCVDLTGRSSCKMAHGEANVVALPPAIKLVANRTRALIEWELDWAYEGLGRHDRTFETWRAEIHRLRAELASLDETGRCAARTAAGYDERDIRTAA
jgi:hypothetical protein